MRSLPDGIGGYKDKLYLIVFCSIPISNHAIERLRLADFLDL